MSTLDEIVESQTSLYKDTQTQRNENERALMENQNLDDQVKNDEIENRRFSLESLPDESDGEHIKVICRVRPIENNTQVSCVNIDEDDKTLTIKSPLIGGKKVFTFDYSANCDTNQKSIFLFAGKYVARATLEGYNGTILCYGQTGSGKTFTMFGPAFHTGPNLGNSLKRNSQNQSPPIDIDEELLGMVPRTMDYLFTRIGNRNNQNTRYEVSCSFYEIYAEKVYDLLDESGQAASLQIREDGKRGVYVEGLVEANISSAADASAILSKGYGNRHIGETKMNRESSRSHAVFSLWVKCKETCEKEGVTKSRTARLNLVDLAGSERQSATGAGGERLKEAGSINKSLSALGNVINALVEQSAGKQRHVHYRDSKLTFLLRDSLGGNTKTALVATLSPLEVNAAETLSTLKFAHRAKQIKNKAIVNEDTTGTLEALQRQIRHLSHELMIMKTQHSSSKNNYSNDLKENSMLTILEAPFTHDNYGDTREQKDSALLQQQLQDLQTKAETDHNLGICALRRLASVENERDQANKLLTSERNSCKKLEENLLNMRMKLKLKEATIKRLSPVQSDSTEPDTNENLSEVQILREELRVLKEESTLVPVEVTTWRKKFEESEVKLLSYKQTDCLWTLEDEGVYTRTLEDKILNMTSDMEALKREILSLKEDETERVLSGEKHIKEYENKIVVLKACNSELDAKLLNLIAEGKILKTDLESQKNEIKALHKEKVDLQMKLEYSDSSCQILNNNFLEFSKKKETEISRLRQELLEMTENHEKEKSLYASESNSELQENFATVMKDNAILLERLRSTATEADDYLERLEVSKDEINMLTKTISTKEEAWCGEREKYEKISNLLTSEKEKKDEEIQNLRDYSLKLEGEQKELNEKLSTLEENFCSIRSSLNIVNDANEELEASVTSLTSERCSLHEEIEAITSEIHESRATIDDLVLKNNELSKEVEETRKNFIQESKDKAELEINFQKSETAREILIHKLNEIEISLEKREHRIDELTKENTSLFSSFESAKAQTKNLEDARSALLLELNQCKEHLLEIQVEVESLQRFKTELQTQLSSTEAELISQQKREEDISNQLKESRYLCKAQSTKILEIEGLCHNHKVELENQRELIQEQEMQTAHKEKLIKEIKEEIQELESTKKALTEDKAFLKTKVVEIEATEASLNDKLKALELEIKVKHEEKESIRIQYDKAIQDLQLEKNEFKVRLESSELSVAQTKSELETVDKNLKDLSKEYDLVMNEKDKIVNSNEKLRLEICEIHSDYQDQLDIIKRELQSSEMKANEIEHTLSKKCEDLLAESKAAKDQIRTEVELLKAELTKKHNEFDFCEKEKSALLIERTSLSEVNEVLKLDIHDLETELKENKERNAKQIKELKKESTILSNEVKKYETRIVDVSNEVTSRDDNIKILQHTLTEKDEEINSLSNDRLKLIDRFKELEKNLEKESKTKASLKSQLEKVSDERFALAEDKENTMKEKELLEKELENRKQEMQQFEKIKHDLSFLEKEKANVSKLMTEAQDLYQSADARIRIAEIESEKMKEEMKKLNTEIQRMERERMDLWETNTKLISHQNQKQKILIHNRLKEELSELTKRCRDLEQENYSLKEKAATQTDKYALRSRKDNSSSSNQSSNNSEIRGANEKSIRSDRKNARENQENRFLQTLHAKAADSDDLKKGVATRGSTINTRSKTSSTLKEIDKSTEKTKDRETKNLHDDKENIPSYLRVPIVKDESEGKQKPAGVNLRKPSMKEEAKTEENVYTMTRRNLRSSSARRL